MDRLIVKLAGWVVGAGFLLMIPISIWFNIVEPAIDPTVVERRRLERERAAAAEQAAALAAMSPAERADAYAAALDPAVRSEAEQDVSAAGIALYSARAAAPLTPEDVARTQAEERAAERRWALAMRRLYGPTWEAYQARLEGQASEAAAGAASSMGYDLN